MKTQAELQAIIIEMERDIQQKLGRALGYPRYCDDQVNFPGSTDADGVCVGDNTAGSLVDEAVALIHSLQERLELQQTLQTLLTALEKK